MVFPSFIERRRMTEELLATALINSKHTLTISDRQAIDRKFIYLPYY